MRDNKITTEGRQVRSWSVYCPFILERKVEERERCETEDRDRETERQDDMQPTMASFLYFLGTVTCVVH